MTEELKNTVRIIRRAKVATDDRGRSVWVDPVETAELDLVSTAMLETLLSGDDEATRKHLLDVASTSDGLLAHDPEKDAFEIVSDDDLQAALAAAADSPVPAPTRSADVVYEIDQTVDDLEELSLVSTQMLKAMLDPAAVPGGTLLDDDDMQVEESGGAFDPYNSS
ncbi:MAG: hypothetical protein AAGA33_07755 [Pseudomonadota bacterium]